MNYKVVQEDIFRHVNEEKARFVQCLSADYAAGKGIAVEFNKYYNIGEILRNHCCYRWNGFGYMVKVPGTPVFNLITKERYFNKPTYISLRQSLISMRDFVIREKYDLSYTFYMPKIGCGLDRLQWDKVERIIHEIFDNVDINIAVCYL